MRSLLSPPPWLSGRLPGDAGKGSLCSCPDWLATQLVGQGKPGQCTPASKWAAGWEVGKGNGSTCGAMCVNLAETDGIVLCPSLFETYPVSLNVYYWKKLIVCTFKLCLVMWNQFCWCPLYWDSPCASIFVFPFILLSHLFFADFSNWPPKLSI